MTSVNTKHEALLDELLKDYTSPQDILGEHGLLKQLTKRVVERVLEAELTAHLGYAPHVRHGTEEQNARNGKGRKTVQTDTGPVDLVVPRDRNGSFTPQLVPKRQRRLEGFDAKVLSLYARGLSTREIQGHLEELYGTEVSPTLISTITDAVLEDVRTWQARPLASVYPILYFDALFVKSRQEGPVQTKAVYLALGVTIDGEKELLGLWLSEGEGAKFWGRHTVTVGLAERRTGLMCLGAQSACSGRKRWEDTHPEAADALPRLAEAHAPQAPTFRTTLASTRLTAQAALEALRAHGYGTDHLPSPSTMAEVLHRMGLRLRKVVKAKPQKQIAETDAIVDQMEKKTSKRQQRSRSND